MIPKLPHDVLRKRGGPDDGKVTFIELFFDLIFVFTIIQLSHTFAHHFTLIGAAETLMLVFAVWWVWIFTTWVMNWLDPDRMPVRLLLFVLMFAGLALSTSIPEAFADKGIYFAGAYAFMQVFRSLFMLAATKDRDPLTHAAFVRLTAWLSVSAVFWVAGGLAASTEQRITLWLIALGIEYVSPAVGFWVPKLGRATGRDWVISGHHMAERCALFVIICMGETILVNGRLIADQPVTPTSVASFSLAFVVTVTMWWIYFRFGHQNAAHHIEATDDPGAVARHVFTYAHIPIVAGIILSAVALEFMIAHPFDPTTAKYAFALLGGPAVYLLGNTWFKGVVRRKVPLSHLAGLALLGLSVFVHARLALIELGALVAGILLVVALWEHRSLAPREEGAG